MLARCALCRGWLPHGLSYCESVFRVRTSICSSRARQYTATGRQWHGVYAINVERTGVVSSLTGERMQQHEALRKFESVL